MFRSDGTPTWTEEDRLREVERLAALPADPGRDLLLSIARISAGLDRPELPDGVRLPDPLPPFDRRPRRGRRPVWCGAGGRLKLRVTMAGAGFTA